MLEFKKIIILIISMVVFTACSHTPIQRHYYIMEYTPTGDNLELPEEPFPYLVQVSDARVSRVYERTQIVTRYSSNKIEYMDYEMWAVRLSGALPDLVIDHFNNYNIFTITDRDFITQRPDYEVIMNVNRIERLHSEHYTAAHLRMEFILRQGDDLTGVISHKVEREDEIFSSDIEIFIQKLSYILREETDLFIEKIIDYFNDDEVIEP